MLIGHSYGFQFRLVEPVPEVGMFFVSSSPPLIVALNCMSTDRPFSLFSTRNLYCSISALIPERKLCIWFPYVVNWDLTFSRLGDCVLVLSSLSSKSVDLDDVLNYLREKKRDPQTKGNSIQTQEKS